MALDFGNTKGKAVKNSVLRYTYTDGDNKVRIFGGVLPRYVYWLKGVGGKPIPAECLAFSRTKEKFDNLEKDWVQIFQPEMKCQWAYSVNCIDPKDGKVKVLDLKKKLFEQVISAAEDLGDPTHPETGWDIVFKRVKSGPNVFNVEYTLQVLRCKPRPLTPEELALVESAPSIDDAYPRPTSEEVKELMEKIKSGEGDAPTSASETEAVSELN